MNDVRPWVWFGAAGVMLAFSLEVAALAMRHAVRRVRRRFGKEAQR